jgi:hypothetical protein
VIPYPLSARDGRYNWKPHIVYFDTAEGLFTVHIYALSAEHAAAIVEEMKATARLGEPVLEVVR